MNKFDIFDKLDKGAEAVYLIDKDECCVMKVFVGKDGETVEAMLKRKGKEPFLADIKSDYIFDIMNESDDTTEQVYEQF